MEIVSIDQQKKRTEMVLANVMKLTSIPEVILELMKMLNREDLNTKDLTKLVYRDQSLVTKILLIANSPFYGLSRKVSTLDFAVMVLGLNEIRNIVSSLSVFEVVRNKSDKYLDPIKFWQHSFLVAQFAKKICEDLGYPESSVAFTAGFLHDVGVSVEHKYFHSLFVKIHDCHLSENRPVQQLETEILGIDHTEISSILLDKWNFPSRLTDSIRNHHSPLQSESNKELSSILHIADYAVKYLNAFSFFWDDDLKLKTESCELLGFNKQEDVHLFIESYRNDLPKIIESMRYLS